MPTSQHCAFGKSGEDLACAELLRHGYAILARRYRTRAGEIDIVARDADTLVFVEVKTRRTCRNGTAAEAMTPSKRRKVVSMAADWLARNRICAAGCRFDVVAIDYDAAGEPHVALIPAAFIAGE